MTLRTKATRLVERLAERRSDDMHIRAAPQMREYHSIVARIAADSPGTLLDWGCGYGQVTRLLLDQGLDVTALDYRENVPGDGYYALDRYPEVKAYLTSDPVRLPFGDGAFQAVLSCGVLEHVHDPDASLEEIRRVLAPGGMLYVYKLPNRFSYLERIAKLVGLYYHGLAPNDEVYDRRTAYALLERHRFRVVEFRRANMLPLSISEGRFAAGFAEPIWRLNRAFSRIPVANLVATNLELVAVAHGGGVGPDGLLPSPASARLPSSSRVHAD
jgi:ubiquinone/menaquinone biosynthesis C-methylase UbiE